MANKSNTSTVDKPANTIAVTGQLLDIFQCLPEVTKFKIALRSWFTSYLTQQDSHVNHSPLPENIYFFEALEEWLDCITMATAETQHQN